MKIVIEVEYLRKAYGSTVAVDDVSFQVTEGEIFGLLGSNGAVDTGGCLFETYQAWCPGIRGTYAYVEKACLGRNEVVRT